MKIGREHLPRGNEAETLAEHPLALEEDDAGERDGDGIERRVGVLETVTVDEARMAHEGPAGKRGRRRREHEYPQRDLATGDKVIASRASRQCTLDTPEDAVGPVQHNEYR